MSLRWKQLFIQDDSIWRALAIGIVCGPIWTAAGEWLRHGTEFHSAWRTIGSIFTLPGVLYGVVTGRDPFATIVSMCVYFLAQIGFYTVVVFLGLAAGRLVLTSKKGQS